MPTNKRIPIKEAERVSKAYDRPMIIVFALDRRGESFSVVTYGENKRFCKFAADIGEQIAERILGGEIKPRTDAWERFPDEPTIWEKKNAEGK